MYRTARKTDLRLLRVLTTAGIAATALVLAACSSTAEGGVTGSSDSSTVESDTATQSASSGSTVSLTHYFSDGFGTTAFESILPACEAETGTTIENGPMGQEQYKQAFLVQLAGGNPPNIGSWWAGAKTAELVNKDLLRPVDDVWKQNGLDDVIPSGLAKAAAEYNGKKYLLPFDYHYVAFFYNPALMKQAGITTMPETWDELMTAAASLKDAGITPFALGSKDAWPAQFWFDYLLLNTAGPDYRQSLMEGKASYTDPEVLQAFSLWKTALDAGYFNESPNAIDANDADDLVGQGKAAMTLMGTWATGAWDAAGVQAGSGYDMFPFPKMKADAPSVALGPVDGWVLPAKAADPENTDKVAGCIVSPDSQKTFAMTAGALAPRTDVDLSEQNSVMQAASKVVAAADSFSFNYDLATPPAVSAEGLNFLMKFVDDPSTYEADLADLQATVAPLFNE